MDDATLSQILLQAKAELLAVLDSYRGAFLHLGKRMAALEQWMARLESALGGAGDVFDVVDKRLTQLEEREPGRWDGLDGWLKPSDFCSQEGSDDA